MRTSASSVITRNSLPASDSPIAGAGSGYSLRTFFRRKDYMHCVPRSRVWAVEEHRHAGRMTVNEPGGFEGGPGGIEIVSSNEDVHVLREAHGRRIDARDPGSDRVSVNDRVGNSRIFEGRRHPAQSVADEFHGTQHPFNRERGKMGVGHAAMLARSNVLRQAVRFMAASQFRSTTVSAGPASLPIAFGESSGIPARLGESPRWQFAGCKADFGAQ